MSMLTQCTACGTVFRITAEQLVARQGEVRCGACHAVFNALAEERAPFAAAPLVAGAAPLDHTVSYPVLNPSALTAPPWGPAPHSVAGLSTPEATSTALVLDAEAPGNTDDAHGPDGASAGSGAGAAAPMAWDAGATGPLPGAATQATSEAAADTAPEVTPEVTAVQTPADTPPADAAPLSARPAARPRFAWWSGAGALLALGALSVQGAYFYRNEIAAHHPQVQPALAALCRHLACTFDAPRDVQSITIESHDLQTDPASKNVLALVALLRNRAGFAQEVPHLELTLMDAQDAALVRRVFTPREHAAAASIGAHSELPVRILLDAGSVKASGYRLYAFYP